MPLPSSNTLKLEVLVYLLPSKWAEVLSGGRPNERTTDKPIRVHVLIGQNDQVRSLNDKVVGLLNLVFVREDLTKLCFFKLSEAKSHRINYVLDFATTLDQAAAFDGLVLVCQEIPSFKG